MFTAREVIFHKEYDKEVISESIRNSGSVHIATVKTIGFIYELIGEYVEIFGDGFEYKNPENFTIAKCIIYYKERDIKLGSISGVDEEGPFYWEVLTSYHLGKMDNLPDSMDELVTLIQSNSLLLLMTS